MKEDIAAKGVFRRKLARLVGGGTPRVLDLFAGCGGLSLGFHLAGFELAAALELDPLAAESHARNFYGNKETFPAHAKPRDITLTDPAPLLAEYGYSESAAEVIDVIVGGPPCQAFARVGRAKLREIAEHPTAYKLDPRGNLYLRFLEYIRQLQPLAILMENVPDVINYGGHNIPEETCEVLEALGYVARYTLLNAAFYGVPQMRERMFLIAYRKELNVPVRFPAPTRYINLPRGYESSRQVALRNVDLDLFNPESHFQEPPLPQNDLEPAVTAADALSDLPKVTLHLEGKLKRGARRFDELIKYRARPRAGSYPEQMRNWPGFEANSGVYDHVIRFLPRDYPIFRRMKPGDEYPQARAEAERMFEEELERLRKDGRTIVAGSVEYSELFDSIVPPYDPQKFPNKWRKLDADQPARTLMAHLGKDSYSHIHYDSQQARTISVREAARLQSFPDGFTFAGAMNAAFRQIGNAVPPLMANALARVIASALPRPYHENPARNKAAHCV